MIHSTIINSHLLPRLLEYHAMLARRNCPATSRIAVAGFQFPVSEGEAAMRIEVEVCPGYWIEMDPRDLYDEHQITLAEHLAAGTVDVTKLDGTYWWTFDLTQHAKEINIIPDPE